MEGLWKDYIELGFDHIFDFKAYDHMLFLLALCIPFTLKDWKKVIILATAFTIGHCITLALNTFNLISISTVWVEFLIPVTIIMTALFDIFSKSLSFNSEKIHYPLALIFGLIHGMGFSNFLKSAMFPGEEHLLFWQLLYFNIGIELGQILIVIIILTVLFALSKILPKENPNQMITFRNIISVMVIIWAAFMAFERIPLL